MVNVDAFARLFRVAVVATAMLLAASVVLAAWSWTSHARAAAWVRHTYRVNLTIGSARAALDRPVAAAVAPAGASSNGRESVVPLLDHLRQLTRDNPAQQRRLDTIQSLAAGFLPRQASEPVWAAPAAEVAGSIAQILRQLDQMEAEENRLLAEREQTLEAARSRQLLIFSGLVGLEVICAVVMLRQVRRIAALKRLVTVCAWSHKVRYEDEWMNFEEYLIRAHGLRLTHGVSPEMAGKLIAEFEQENPA